MNRIPRPGMSRLDADVYIRRLLQQGVTRLADVLGEVRQYIPEISRETVAAIRDAWLATEHLKRTVPQVLDEAREVIKLTTAPKKATPRAKSPRQRQRQLQGQKARKHARAIYRARTKLHKVPIADLARKYGVPRKVIAATVAWERKRRLQQEEEQLRSDVEAERDLVLDTGDADLQPDLD